MNDKIKVWITKYALTAGIKEVEAEVCVGTSTDMIAVDNPSGHPRQLYYHGEGRDWHRSREAAIKKAEDMKQKKISGLNKQIAKLQKIKFE